MTVLSGIRRFFNKQMRVIETTALTAWILWACCQGGYAETFKEVGNKNDAALELVVPDNQSLEVGKANMVTAYIRNASSDAVTLMEPSVQWNIIVRGGANKDELAEVDIKLFVSYEDIAPEKIILQPGDEYNFEVTLSYDLYALPEKPGDYFIQLAYGVPEGFWDSGFWTGQIFSNPVMVRIRKPLDGQT